ncbi:MAG: ferredoxin family protein [Bacillota bacterium]
MDFNKIPREEIPWFPTVDKDKCTGCQTCFNFCSHKTYAWDDKGNVAVVANPFNCVVGCTGCESQCPTGAISFPNLDVLKEVREKYKDK